MDIRPTIKKFDPYPFFEFDIFDILEKNNKTYVRIKTGCLTPYFILWLRCKYLEHKGYEIIITKIEYDNNNLFNSTIKKAYAYWKK